MCEHGIQEVYPRDLGLWTGFLPCLSGWAVGLSCRVDFWKRKGLQKSKAEGLRAYQEDMSPQNEQNWGALVVGRLYRVGTLC